MTESNNVRLSQQQPLPSMTEAAASRALVHGALVGCVYQYLIPLLRQPASIDQPVDEQAAYLPYFRLHLASGTVLRISVDVETPPSD